MYPTLPHLVGVRQERTRQFKCSCCTMCYMASHYLSGSAQGPSDLEMTNVANLATQDVWLQLQHEKRMGPCPLPQDINGKCEDYTSVNLSDHSQIHRAGIIFSVCTLLYLWVSYFYCQWCYPWAFLRPQEIKSFYNILHSLNLKGRFIYG